MSAEENKALTSTVCTPLKVGGVSRRLWGYLPW
jgi:hypothetical protein